jgi:sugar-phosphatase
VIFDMDGVLINSEPLWHVAEIEVFGALDVPLTPEDCVKTTGRRIDEVARYWFERRPWQGPPPERVARSIVARVCELVTERGEAMPWAREAVRFVAELGVRVGLASSSDEVLIRTVLARLGIAAHFEVTHSAEHEPHGKPHPGVYLRTAERLGVRPARCLAIEDSGNGIRAAVAAEMSVVVVPDLPVAPDVLALATDVLPSLEALPAWWTARVTSG